MVICLERGADLHMAQLMPLPLTVSCFSKIQVSFTFLVPAHPAYGAEVKEGSERQRKPCRFFSSLVKTRMSPLVGVCICFSAWTLVVGSRRNAACITCSSYSQRFSPGTTHTHTSLTALCPGLHIHMWHHNKPGTSRGRKLRGNWLTKV